MAFTEIENYKLRRYFNDVEVKFIDISSYRKYKTIEIIVRGRFIEKLLTDRKANIYFEEADKLLYIKITKQNWPLENKIPQRKGGKGEKKQK